MEVTAMISVRRAGRLSPIGMGRARVCRGLLLVPVSAPKAGAPVRIHLWPSQYRTGEENSMQVINGGAAAIYYLQDKRKAPPRERGEGLGWGLCLACSLLCEPHLQSRACAGLT